jgi:hypothetical protein
MRELFTENYLPEMLTTSNNISVFSPWCNNSRADLANELSLATGGIHNDSTELN